MHLPLQIAPPLFILRVLLGLHYCFQILFATPRFIFLSKQLNLANFLQFFTFPVQDFAVFPALRDPRRLKFLALHTLFLVPAFHCAAHSKLDSITNSIIGSKAGFKVSFEVLS